MEAKCDATDIKQYYATPYNYVKKLSFVMYSTHTQKKTKEKCNIALTVKHTCKKLRHDRCWPNDCLRDELSRVNWRLRAVSDTHKHFHAFPNLCFTLPRRCSHTDQLCASEFPQERVSGWCIAPCCSTHPQSGLCIRPVIFSRFSRCLVSVCFFPAWLWCHSERWEAYGWGDKVPLVKGTRDDSSVRGCWAPVTQGQAVGVLVGGCDKWETLEIVLVEIKDARDQWQWLSGGVERELVFEMSGLRRWSTRGDLDGRWPGVWEEWPGTGKVMWYLRW